MQWSRCCLVLFMCTSAWSQQAPKASFAIEITPSQDAIQPGVAVWKKGAPVFFIITMTNNSGRTLHFALTNPAFNYPAIVLDRNGIRVPQTEHYRKLRDKRNRLLTTRNILVALKPHSSCADGIEVSYLYGLSKPGEYTVQLEREMPPELGAGVVVSNQVRIAIAP